MPELMGIVTAVPPHDQDYSERLRERATWERELEENRARGEGQAEALRREARPSIAISALV
jgi:hypothetical protein